ncbi:MAG: TnpV protein [Erysipelotrichaceae bacterium]|nr:TnpV protein [Erysipelotrichaceae bacterium]
MKKLDYVEVGGILYPDLHVNVKEFGHFGTKKTEYMKMYHPDEYVLLMAKDTLFDYLEKIDIQASNMYDRLVEQYKKQRNITEELKTQDQMLWVQEMNNIKVCVNEVILNELIYE